MEPQPGNRTEGKKNDETNGRQYGEKLLARAQTHLENNKVRKSRKLLNKLTNHEDQRIQQHALELIQTSPEERKNRFSIVSLTRILTVTVLAVVVLTSLVISFQLSTLPGAEETRQLAHSAHIHVKKTNVKGESNLELFGNRYDYSLKFMRMSVYAMVSYNQSILLRLTCFITMSGSKIC